MKPCGKFNGEFRRNPEFPVYCISLLILSALLTGCATRGEFLRLKEDAAVIRATVDTMNINVQDIRLQMEAVQMRQERLVEEMVTQSDLRQLRGYLGSRLDEYQMQSQMLSDQINDLSQRLTGVAQRVDEIKYRTKGPSMLDSTAGADVVEAEPRQIYDQAYLDLSRGNYDLARTGFEEYLRLYPDTELADNAQYWLGEVAYVQHKYKDAMTQFQLVEEKYPTGNKVAAALFKVGLCQIQLHQKSKARETLKRLTDLHPGTPEAAQAQAKLKTLK